jgi:peptidoglycan hydrolase-like protein with peptidoglycan-binding domain
MVSKPVSYAKRAENLPSDVIIVKKFLNTYENANLTVNGTYDEAMLRAVIKWQEKYRSVVLAPQGLKKGTGYVYLASIEQMKRQQKSSCAVPKTPVVTTPVTPTTPTTTVTPATTPKVVAEGAKLCFNVDLKLKANGPEVTKLQKFLTEQGLMTVAPNGNFGPSTEVAVRAFQTAHPESYTTSGFTKPTGWFYSNTRAVANKLTGCTQ